MRRFLLLLVILIKSSFGQAQIHTDTICIEVPKFKKIYAAALQKKVADSLLTISEKQIAQLENTIRLLGEKDAEQKAGYDNQLDILHQEQNIYKDQIAGYERLLKKERRKRFFTSAGGILTTGILTYLLISK